VKFVEVYTQALLDFVSVYDGTRTANVPIRRYVDLLNVRKMFKNAFDLLNDIS